jgi:hypothetical protein
VKVAAILMIWSCLLAGSEDESAIFRKMRCCRHYEDNEVPVPVLSELCEFGHRIPVPMYTELIIFVYCYLIVVFLAFMALL